jgi:hypothetical protein
VIFAHGGENEDCVLLDKNGQHWDLTLPKTLPEEVLIIACASYDGNLHDLAVQCLERGARNVVCGHGKLNHKSMIAILSEWVTHRASAYKLV